MQRVCRVEGGVNEYLENPRCLLTEENCWCPLCPEGHRLRKHGTYKRQALFPDPEAPKILLIYRLLCVRTGQTVSLLPDFCLPRRQYGPSILGLFIHSLLEGAGLLKALKTVRREAERHSTAQSLLRGFLEKAPKIRTYLAVIRPRVVEPPQAITPGQQLLGALFHGLRHGFSDPSAAFTFHGLRIHQRFQISLA